MHISGRRDPVRIRGGPSCIKRFSYCESNSKQLHRKSALKRSNLAFFSLLVIGIVALSNLTEAKKNPFNEGKIIESDTSFCSSYGYTFHPRKDGCWSECGMACDDRAIHPSFRSKWSFVADATMRMTCKTSRGKESYRVYCKPERLQRPDAEMNLRRERQRLREQMEGPQEPVVDESENRGDPEEIIVPRDVPFAIPTQRPLARVAEDAFPRAATEGFDRVTWLIILVVVGLLLAVGIAAALMRLNRGSRR